MRPASSGPEVGEIEDNNNISIERKIQKQFEE
jgi:hypothetical protein